MSGLEVSRNQFKTLFGLAGKTIEQWAEDGMPTVTRDGGEGDDSPTQFEFDPFKCSKRDVCNVFGVKPSDVDTWVRQGCPCVPSGKGRSPLIFDLPKVFRWYHVFNSGNYLAAEKDVQIWDLELTVERFFGLLVKHKIETAEN